ncbi:hypothetical protein [Oceanobacillus manasiensis]|uniref:hypothetical protein n=1 Tax=Oceanobacillus manasiensis TaxID=586413 RepID=UPI0005AACD3E|nr:hypothetical protein [Oceanobacillus manasiensis]
MKKYWKLLSITIVIVLSISTFYIQKAIANEKTLQLELDTISGDESEIEGVALTGWYYGNFLHEGFAITGKKNIKYESDNSFVESLQGASNPKFDQLIEDHRSFMRGKYSDLSLFYEDEELLAYVDVDSTWGRQSSYEDHSFKIDVLEKESDERITFEQKVPNHQDYHYMHVINVQVQGGQLSVFTRNDVNYDGSADLRVYNFDIASEKLINEKSIVLVDGRDESKWVDGYLVSAGEEIQQTETLVYSKTEMQETQSQNGEYYTEETSREYIAYNLSTMKKNELSIPKEMWEGALTETAYDNIIYFLYQTEEGFTVKSYNIENQQEGEFNVEMPGSEIGVEYTMQAKDDRLYFVKGGENLTIMVTDASTGDTLYHGKYINTESGKENHEISLGYLFIK